MKFRKKTITLCSICISLILTATTCERHTFSFEEGCNNDNNHPNILFVNRSDNPIWLEWNPRYPMSESDSLFSGFQVRVKDTLNLMPLKSLCWEGELKKIPFVRIFLFDAPYNSISNHPDSLLRFQEEHLIDMHWYTRKELDSLNWTIHYPTR